MKINNISNIDKKLLPSEFEPVFEEDERPEKTHKEISSTRLKIIKDSKEDSISSNEPKQQYYLSTNIYDKIFDSIQEEDHNENLFEQELKSSKSYKNFTDKLDGIEEMNDLVFDTFNIESIKEENNEEEEFNTNKMNISGYMQFADESEKLNCYKILSRVNLDGEDIILENELDDEDKNNENENDV